MMQSRVHDIHFELVAPDSKNLNEAYMKPAASTFLLEEVLKDINDIICNRNHQQCYEYNQALIEFKRIKCWIYIFLILTLLIGVGWALYIFFLCDMMTKSSLSCNYMDYMNNMINQICWTLFILSLIIILLLIIYGNYSFRNKAKMIINQWRIAIKEELEKNIEERRKTSPQNIFDINYQTLYRKRSELMSGIVSIKRNINNINITNKTSNSDQLTPVTETSDVQINNEILNQIANQNNEMINALVHGYSQSNFNNINHNAMIQQIGSSQSNINTKHQHSNNNLSVLSVSDSNKQQQQQQNQHINQYINQYDNGAGDYGQNTNNNYI